MSDNLRGAIGFFEIEDANDAEGGEIFQAESFEGGGVICTTADGYGRFLIAADDFVFAERFEGEKNGVAKRHKLLPLWLVGLPVDCRINFG